MKSYYRLDWPTFKALADKKHARVQKIETPNALELLFTDSGVSFECILWKPGEVGYEESHYSEWFSLYDEESNLSTTPLVNNGKLLSIAEPREGTEVIISTHNLCDKCTWYGDSVRVVSEVLTRNPEDPPGLYRSAHPFWIDMVSGRVQNDDNVSLEQKLSTPSDPHGYLVEVKVNGTERPMREPLEVTGGDYSIQWEEGTIQFVDNLPGGGDVVTASYSYATTSTFYLRPFPENALNVEAAEADFSSDVEMTDGIEYGVWGFVEVFAPQYAYTPSSTPWTFTEGSTVVTGSGYDDSLVGKYVRRVTDPPTSYMIVGAVISPTELALAAPYSGTSGNDVPAAVSSQPTGVYPVGTRIPLTNLKYKRLINIYQEGIGSYPVINKAGASVAERALDLVTFRNTSRGVKGDFQAIPFRYATLRKLDSSYGLEVRIRTSHDRVFGGEAAYLTFYGTVVSSG